jgi:asparagine synthase (glutamine-hydrolysing)
MCGFAGVIVWDERYRVAPETLRRMSAAVAHRGPDGEGIHLSREHEPITPGTPQVALAFRRLAILDPDPRSMQPFTDGRRWLVFNGEIYNFRDLRAELTTLLPEYQWRTTGDTEVLLAAYAAWGERCVEKLNGMFAFAVWDDQERTLFLARDRMGQKPLYRLRTDGGRMAFASEVPALRAMTPATRPVFAPALQLYLQYGYTDSIGLRADLAELHPGDTEFVRVGQPTPGDRTYFDCNVSTDVERTAGQTRDLVRRAVERQLVSDVPLGVFLSGGIDSSVMAACARRSGPVRTFAIAFDDPAYDESAHARAVADHLGTEHVEFRVTPCDVADALPRLAAALGEPFADSSALPTHYLCRETRRHVKVALSGDGGDELFGGYDRYRAMRWARWTGWLRPLSPLGRALARGRPKARITRAGRFLAGLGRRPADWYEQIMRVYDDRTIAALMPGGPADIYPRVAQVFQQACSYGHTGVEAAAATDRVTYLPCDLLVKTDRCSMLHGLEVRSPFMDPDVVTFAAGLTTEQLLKGGPKRMLREAFADDLPAWVFKRRKMGFAVPVGDWFRGPLRGMLRDTLFSAHAFGRSHFDMAVVQRLVDEHESHRVDHGQRLYALLMLELWWDTVRTTA